jgi:hypothetical protein
LSFSPKASTRELQPESFNPRASTRESFGFFPIGLAAAGPDRDRNLRLLKESAWIDIPVVCNDSRRAIIALEKGTPGENACADAFAA